MADGADWVIWGSSGHGMVLADAIALRGGRVVALVDNDPAAQPCVSGAPLCAGEDGLRRWLAARGGSSGLRAAVAIGGARGADRRRIGAVLHALGLRLAPVIHPTAAVATSATIAEGCHVLANAVVAARASLGEMGIVNNGAVVDHECRLAPGVHVAPGATLCGCVDVGEDAMVGAGATVLPRLRIGRGAVVGAGAVVTRAVPDGAVVVGIPAATIEGRCPSH